MNRDNEMERDNKIIFYNNSNNNNNKFIWQTFTRQIWLINYILS